MMLGGRSKVSILHRMLSNRMSGSIKCEYAL